MSSNSSSSGGTSSFSQLIARLLLQQVLNPIDPPPNNTPQQPQPNIRNSIIELSHQYNESINEYNANIAHYNRNIDRIIRLLEHEIGIPANNTPVHQSNTYAQHTHAHSQSYYPYTSSYRNANIRMDISHNILLDGSGVVMETPHIVNAVYLPEPSSTNSTGTATYMQGQSSVIQTYNDIINNSFISNPTNRQFLGRIRRDNIEEGLTEQQIQNVTLNVVFDACNNSLSYHGTTPQENCQESSFSIPTQCPISLDDFVHGEELLQIRECNHVFKPVELRRWLSNHSKCPVCRCDVTSNGMYVNLPTNENTETDDIDYSDMPQLITADDDDEETYDIAHANANTILYFREYGLYNYPEHDE